MESDILELSTWTEKFTQTATQFKDAILGYLPNFIGALVVLIVGFLLAKLFKAIGIKIGQFAFKLLLLFEKKFKIKGYRNQEKFAQTIGIVLFWIVLIYFVFFALNILSLPGIMVWVERFTDFLPNLFGALAIIYVGFVLGSVARNLIFSRSEESSTHDPYFLAQTVRFGIITLFIIWGVDQLGINIHILTNVINIIVACVFGAAALGFGIGASGHVANLIAAHNIKKSYKPGESIQIEQVKGTIIDITSYAIIIQTDEGLVFLPARKTLESISSKSM